jgi:AcrR family transcriptional regulator
VTVNQSDPRVKRTRQLLQQALVSLLAEKDFRSITVQDIAGKATVNRATFYAHFDGKYALMDAVVRERFREAVSSKLHKPAAPTRESLRLFICRVGEFLAKLNTRCRQGADPEFHALIEAIVQDELYAIVLACQRTKRSDGVREKRFRMETVAAVVSWGIFGGAREWSRRSRPKFLEETADQMVELLSCVLSRVSGVAFPVTRGRAARSGD